MQLFLSLLFLQAHVAAVTAVAGCHGDRDKDHRPRENCTAAGFSDVPAGFELTTKVLLFPSNLFSSLSWTSFQIFPEIYEIDLTGNKVPEVTPTVSEILPSLRVLRLGSNRLTSLSDHSFSACPGLAELYLQNNIIDSLSDHTFSGLSKLEILELSSNRIKVLPKLMLHPLPAIETVYLENNKIKVMPDYWFSPKEEVPYLYLSANPWICSCTLGYLRNYLEEYEVNIYVRDGADIRSDGESVVCDSPYWHKGKPVLSLEESELCSSPTISGPTGDFYQPPAADIPATTHLPHPPTITTATPTTTTTPIPTTTSPIPTTTATPTTTTAPAHVPTSQAFVEELHTEYHRVVTWSWYQTFTRFIEWSEYSGSAVRSEMPLVGSRTLTTHPTPLAIRPSTKRPTEAVRTRFVPLTTPKLRVTTTTMIPSWVIVEPGGHQHGRISAVGGAGVFCFWLFAGCLLLCVASAVCILATVAWLVMWHKRVYKPLCMMLTRRGGGGEGMRLLMYNRREEGGVMALYRSVLYIHREGGDEDGGKEGGEGGKESLLVTLEPTGGGGGAMREEGEGKGREERGVYRKTLYRLLSKEEEIEGWRDVMEECRVSAEDGGRRGGGKDEGVDREGGGVSRKRYSVILREEREEAGGGREELDWVVGGWEVKRGGGGGEGREESRGSWGEWLAHYLPSMPWGVTTPPEGEAAQ